MRLIRGNVERVAESQEQINELEKGEGYKELSSTLQPKEEPAGKAEEMTVAELRELAKEHGIEGTAGLNKAAACGCQGKWCRWTTLKN